MTKYKILVVEDDDFFRQALTDVLGKRFHVSNAPNGKVAKDIMLVQDFDLILSDIQMPNLTGLELLEWSQSYKPVPFVIMTGFSMALETKSADELGAKGFIAKPFKNAELIATIESILPQQGEKQPSGLAKPEEYCKVSIDEFVARPTIGFDVFIKLSDNKMVKIAHKGDAIPTDKLHFYRDKGLKYLYIPKEEFGNLVEFNMNISKMIKDRNDISQAKKLNFLKFTGELILEKIFIKGLDAESFNEANAFLNLTLDTITQDETRFEILSLLSNHSDIVYAHSLGVAIFSVMMAKKMGFESSNILFKLSEAGLYHDIGKKEIDREVLQKPRHLLTTEERKLIESHVTRGREILNSMRSISEDVVRIVSEHHEDMQGMGYPKKKKKNDLHPLSRIVQLANIFMEQTLNAQDGTVKMEGGPAVAYVNKIYGDRIDPQCFQALKALFN